MEYEYLKKQIRWFCKTEFNGGKTQEKDEPEEKVLVFNAVENKWENNTIKLFKGEFNNCGRSGHRASDCWVNSNKNKNIKDNNNARNPCFNGECNNCGKRGHTAVYYQAGKGKEKDYDVDNLFVEATFCGEVQEENKEKDSE